MPNELNVLIGKIAELNGRSTEIGSRIREDARLIAQIQHELSAALEGIWMLINEPKPMPTLASSGPRILRLAEVAKRVGLARSSVWRMVKDGHFPAPRRLSRRAVGWTDSDIDAWVEGCEALPSPTRTVPRRRRS